jgi:hypothetical protein
MRARDEAKITATGHRGRRVAHHERRHADSVLDHLDAAKHISFGVWERLALLDGNELRDLRLVLPQQMSLTKCPFSIPQSRFMPVSHDFQLASQLSPSYFRSLFRM